MYTLASMGMQVGTRELRLRAAEILRAVEEGEVVTVTRRGRPVAEIRPVRAGRRKLEEDAFGMWRDRKDMEDPSAWVRNLRRRRLDRLYSTRTS
jgi:prevent-host-death family protein